MFTEKFERGFFDVDMVVDVPDGLTCSTLVLVSSFLKLAAQKQRWIKRRTFSIILAIENERQHTNITRYHGRLDITTSEVKISRGIAVHIACVKHISDIPASEEQDLGRQFRWNVSGEADCWRVADRVEE